MTTPGGVVTYGSLELLIEAYASHVQRLVPPGDVLAAVAEPGHHVLALVIACQRTGRGVFPVLPHHQDWLDLNLGITIAAKWTEEHPGGPLATLDAARGQVHESSSGFLVFRTSGSTGIGTGHRQTPRRGPHRGVVVGLRHGLGPGIGPRLLANPTYHHGTLGPALQALEAGNGLVLTSPVDPPNADELLATARATGAGSAILTVDQLVELAPNVGAALPPTLRYVVHSGSPCPHDVKRRWSRHLGAGLIEYYGTSRGVVTTVDGLEWLQREGTVGRPVPGARVRVVDANGREVVGRPGRVLLLHRHGGEAEEPGDVGLLDKEGYLYLAGRDADVDDAPEAVADAFTRESMLALIAGARLWYTGPDPVRGEQVMIVERESGVGDDALQALREGCDHVEVLPPGTLPRTSTGKVDRTATRAWLAQRGGGAR